MAATIASQTAVHIQRAPEGLKEWHAIAGKLTVARALTLDTLVDTLTGRWGPLTALLLTGHTSKATDPEPDKPYRERAPRKRNSKGKTHGKAAPVSAGAKALQATGRRKRRTATKDRAHHRAGN